MLANPKNENQFGSLTRRRPYNKRKNATCSIEDFNYLARRDKRMRFNNARDPIYYVFDCVENRPVSTLAKEFVKDTIFEITNFVSRVVG